MRFPFFAMPDDWPISLWFFVATVVVFLLQWFPLTGIFLMFLLAMGWSIVLVNLGFIGIGLEVIVGRVNPAWLILPVFYFGGYYVAYAADQATLAALRATYASQNEGQTIPFDQTKQDLLFVPGKGDFHPGPADMVRRFGLKRAFAGTVVHFIGNKEALDLLRGNEVLRSAGVYSSGFFTEGGHSRRLVKDYGQIHAPGQPSRPVVEVHSDEVSSVKLLLPVRTQEIRIEDATGRKIELRGGAASPLRPFPMPIIGCGLNSGAPSWDCGASFLRSRASISAPGKSFSDGAALIATALGLRPNDDYASVASGPEVLQAVGDAADRKLVDTEFAKLQEMLVNPARDVRDGWFRHLPNRPDVIAPSAGRIFAALHALQRSSLAGSENGRNLWRLVAALPDDALARHRPQMIEWLKPGIARPWTEQVGEIYARLDGDDPTEREILLHRLETRRGDLEGRLLASFCRMGSAAPDDVKRRLLAIWQKGPGMRTTKGFARDRDEVPLYFTLARIGLKKPAGKVEQRYYGPTFAGIWNEVTPDFPDDLCSGSVNDISNRFRKR